MYKVRPVVEQLHMSVSPTALVPFPCFSIVPASKHAVCCHVATHMYIYMYTYIYIYMVHSCQVMSCAISVSR